MFVFVTGLFFGFISGFSCGYLFKYCRNIFIKYKQSKDPKRAVIDELFTIYTNHIFDTIYTTLETKQNSTFNVSEVIDLTSYVLDIGNEYNKSYKIVMIKGVPVIKLIDNNYINDNKFVKMLEFLKKNDIELTIQKLNDNDKYYKIE